MVSTFLLAALTLQSPDVPPPLASTEPPPPVQAPAEVAVQETKSCDLASGQCHKTRVLHHPVMRATAQAVVALPHPVLNTAARVKCRVQQARCCVVQRRAARQDCCPDNCSRGRRVLGQARARRCR